VAGPPGGPGSPNDDVSESIQHLVHALRVPLHQNTRQVRVFAVKVDGEGWLGVGADLGRCQGHGHETPELAKLCALHRLQSRPPDSNVVLLPLAAPSPNRRAARASG
jgi:hypothetical protein